MEQPGVRQGLVTAKNIQDELGTTMQRVERWMWKEVRKRRQLSCGQEEGAHMVAVGERTTWSLFPTGFVT